MSSQDKPKTGVVRSSDIAADPTHRLDAKHWLGDDGKTVIPQLNPEDLGMMIREANRGLMVAFINADLLNRAQLDVRQSIVLYDESQMFEYAMPELPDPATQQRLLDQTPVRFWSKGI